MIEPRRHQWVLALLFALAAHLALAKLLEPPAPIELDAPGIRIALGGAGPAGGDGADGAVESIAADTLPSATLEPTALQAVSSAALAAVSATATETIRATEPAPPRPIAAAEPVTPKPKTETVKSRETPPPRTARDTPKPKQPAETEPQPTKPRPNAAKAASGDTAGTAIGRQSAGGAGSPSAAGAGGGGTSGKADGGKSKDRYYAELAAWLERHKRYPPQARKMRQEGIVRVRFVIDRNGRVISHRIETSSGHTALDHAASELLRRASPMPAIPASMGQSRLEIVVPIAYRLR
ncbi:energy transducer TonB [Thiocapsa rosea]|uniref:Protein TonB n=1 Tax=Thiocapsa rosea TaxID=69360 RepID=A0A495VAM0_9GAMM|nr:energy transducer TonB [Thiocapsa rosea]RKT44838.1 outer membrane transport energization protein TonB [Thiocapsa rosea]